MSMYEERPVETFRRWLISGLPGSRCVYFRGASTWKNEMVREVMRAAWRAAMDGAVDLVQRRLPDTPETRHLMHTSGGNSPWPCEYIAIKRRRVRPLVERNFEGNDW